MAPLAIAAAVIGGAGMAISAISQAGALRGQAKARQIEGEQELQSARRQLRQELGLLAVGIGGSGLLGSSFSNVFESQIIEDAEFLGRIKQRTDFDVANLKRQARITMVTGLITAGAATTGGLAGAKADQARLDALQASRKNVFSTVSPAGPSPFRIPTTATFF